VAGEVVNPFRGEAAARRYAEGRLDVHAEFARRILGGLGGRRIRSALDLGCGTGLSARALEGIAARVAGVDCSAPMLAEAGRRFRGPRVLARAEALPFAAGAFDLVTMGCVFHWCEPGALLREVARVLGPDGHLAVYDHCLAGRMEGEPRFAAWWEGYRARFPAPLRHPHFDATRAPGFVAVARERFEHFVPLGLDALVRYVASQSNVLSAGRAGDAGAELRAGLAPLFEGRPSAPLAYQGELDVLRRGP
jgi:SAM-dependent methyltransferase